MGYRNLETGFISLEPKKWESLNLGWVMTLIVSYIYFQCMLFLL